MVEWVTIGSKLGVTSWPAEVSRGPDYACVPGCFGPTGLAGTPWLVRWHIKSNNTCLGAGG